MIRPYGEPRRRLTAAASVEANTAAPGLRTSSAATTPGIRYTPLRIAASGGKKSSGAASTPKTRVQAQKTTPKATPRTAGTTMSTGRPRTPAGNPARGAGGSGDGRAGPPAPAFSRHPAPTDRWHRTTDGRPDRPLLPPDSLRRHDPDQVRGSAVSRTLSAEALPCRFLLLCLRA